MKTHHSDIFGSLPAPETMTDLLQLVMDEGDDRQRNVRMWRGQADIAWPLHSAAYRRLARTRSKVTDQSLSAYEKSLLERATHRGFRTFEGRQLSDLELLARLQHHGAATRLLDTTRSLLVGSYFACEGHPSATGLLVGFHADTLGGYEGRSLYRDYDEAMADLADYAHPQTWEPTNVSPRIAAQHSQFLYSAVSQDVRGSLWIDKLPYALLAIAINPSLKQIARRYLSEVFDIRELTLFPDIFGFGQSNSTHHDEFDYARW